MENILRIDMGGTGGPTASLDPDGRYAGLAGRAMTSLLVSEEVDPGCHPLGGANKLVLAPGPRPETPSGASAFSVGCKSPLTGGILASGAGGLAAAALRSLGYAAVVVQGQPTGDDLWTIVIDAAGVTFAVDNGYRLAGVLETVAKLRRAHGPGAALLTIGPAGEMGLGAASLVSAGGHRPAHCGRGGAGAVLGSKRVKAIVLEGGTVAAALPEPRDASEGAAEPPPDARGPTSPYRDACGIRDPVVLGQLEALEDDLGLDDAEVAAAVCLAMEAGLARFGDGQAALRLVEEIARWTPLGRIVGSGLRAMAEAFGLEPRVARWGLDAAASPGSSDLPALAAGAASSRPAREVIAAERRFLARARAAAAEDGAREGDPGVRPHPIVFGTVEDDVARLFGLADPDADPFDPQLQLHVGLRASNAGDRSQPARLVHPLHGPSDKN